MYFSWALLRLWLFIKVLKSLIVPSADFLRLNHNMMLMWQLMVASATLGSWLSWVKMTIWQLLLGLHKLRAWEVKFRPINFVIISGKLVVRIRSDGWEYNVCLGCNFRLFHLRGVVGDSNCKVFSETNLIYLSVFERSYWIGSLSVDVIVESQLSIFVFSPHPNYSIFINRWKRKLANWHSYHVFLQWHLLRSYLVVFFLNWPPDKYLTWCIQSDWSFITPDLVYVSQRNDPCGFKVTLTGVSQA